MTVWTMKSMSVEKQISPRLEESIGESIGETGGTGEEQAVLMKKSLLLL